MRCRFTAKNGKSIRDKVTLDLRAADILGTTLEDVFKYEDGECLPPVAILMGIPGSGSFLPQRMPWSEEYREYECQIRSGLSPQPGSNEFATRPKTPTKLNRLA